jgi:nucleotide-binding universal stress UspA family protein
MGVGEVARVVVDQARQLGSELIVMGLNRHGLAGRAMGRNTVGGVMAIGGVPVLAVRPELSGLPKRVVVAMDFSRASIRAAHFARRVLDDKGTMTLLFVEPAASGQSRESDEGPELIRKKGVAAMFDQVVSSLGPPSGVTVVTAIRTGEPAAEIARFCDETHADLVAVGSQRHRFLDRLFLGSVSKAIAGYGRWSVLVTPPEKST